MRIGRLIVASAITSLSSLLIATSAHAVVANLNPAHVGAFAATFNQECTGPFNPLPAGTDGWHFVLPGQGEFQSITLNYSGGVTAGPITSTTAQSGPGWTGFLDSAGQGGGLKHAYVFTSPVGLQLLGGTATTTAGDSFNLSHTCSGSPRPSTTPSSVPSGGAETGGGGSYSMPIAGIGALAIAGALAAFLFRHRRRDEIA
jgi:LPXTG-motif cell wall-anchored protein